MKKLIICLFTVAIGFSCQQNQDNGKKNTAINTTDNPVDSVQEPEYKQYQLDSIKVEEILDNIGDESYVRAKNRKTIDDIVQEADDLNEAGAIISSTWEKTVPKVKKAKELLLKIQKEDFPILRKNYVAIAKKKMWEEDVDVNGQGDWIVFSGAYFAPHRVIQQTEDALNDMLLKLRFHSVTFEWYRNASDGTRYNLQSKLDTDI